MTIFKFLNIYTENSRKNKTLLISEIINKGKIEYDLMLISMLGSIRDDIFHFSDLERLYQDKILIKNVRCKGFFDPRSEKIRYTLNLNNYQVFKEIYPIINEML